jgi:curved DNA-binding protein CbpA
MPSARTHYDTLNVSPDAEIVVIEAAYRALMKRYHPDQGSPPSGGPSAAEINQAFAVLRDPARRSDYDRVEWIRQKDFRIAQYNATVVAHPSKFFGWGGWLVALLLAGAIGIIASQSGGLPQLPNVQAAKASSLRQPERSQPEISAADAVPPAELAEIRADAMLGRSAANDAGRAVGVRAAPQQHAARSRASPRRHAAARKSRTDKDFVEQHGGIY